MNQIVDRVIARFGITREEFFTKTQRRDITDARYVFYYIATHRKIRNVFVLRFMEKNGLKVLHGSVIHGVKEMRYRIEEDPDYMKIIGEMQKNLVIN